MQIIKLNLVPGKVLPVCYTSQYDEGRSIRALLFDGEEEYTLTTETVTLEVRKSDGNIVTESLTVTSGVNYVDIVTTQQMCAVVGKNLCELRISNSSINIGTINFIMEIQIDPADGSISSNSAIHNLNSQITREVDTLFNGYYAGALALKTDSGNPVSFNTMKMPVKALYGEIKANKVAGTPTPQSPKTITAIDSILIHNGATSPYDQIEYELPLEESSWGGNLSIVNGVTTYTSAKKRVDLSELTWNYTNGIFTASITDGQTLDVVGEIDYDCETYDVRPSGASALYSDEDYVVWHGKSATKNWVYIRDSRYNTKQAFQAAVSGKLVYISTTSTTTTLQTPVIETLDGDNNFNVPNGTLTITHYMSVSETIEDAGSGGNILYGKKWAVCGDSFTNGVLDSVIGEGRYYDQHVTYPWLIGNRNNMDIVKFFANGQTLGWPASPGTFTKSLTNPNGNYYYQNIPADVDYITIYLGINDEHHSSGDEQIPLGTIDDETTATYLGAYNVVIDWLITNRPNAHIGIIVSNGIQNNNNYRTGQIAIAQKYGLGYIDLNGDGRTPAMLRTSNSGIPSSVKQKLIDKWAVTSTDTHPNDAAHRYESTFIEAFLRSI